MIELINEADDVGYKVFKSIPESYSNAVLFLLFQPTWK